MKKKLTCSCGYTEEHEVKEGETLDGLKCPNCDEPMSEEE